MNVNETAKYYVSFINSDLLKTLLLGLKKGHNDHRKSLEAAYYWICNAQDAFEDGGVARSYSLIYNPYFKRKGWFPSYPETTGYIIPTIFAYFKRTGKRCVYDRALSMADWECNIQLANGAIQGGFIGQAVSPAIFNTGQVIFGWIQTFTETGIEKYLDSAVKAGEFLKISQDEDGAWRRNLSNFSTNSIPFFSYNTRTAWALCALYEKTGNKAYLKSAIKNIEFTLKHQNANGFFENNCLSCPDKPLLHTIAYCIRGILEVGISLSNEKYIERARLAADKLLVRMDRKGKLAGRYDSEWKAAASWSCLTGQAQMAVIWGRLFQVYGEPAYFNALTKVNRFLMKKQLLFNKMPHLHGGLTGSDPISGAYGKYEIFSWAVKFFMDSLIIEEDVRAKIKT